MTMARKSFTLVSVGPVTTESPSASKKPWPSLSSRRSRGLRPCAQARASVSGASSAPAISSWPSTPSVSPASAWTPGWPSSAMRQRQQELDVAAAAALAAHGDRGLAAGQQHARRRERLAAPRHLQRDAGQRLADLARLAFDRVAEDVRRHAGVARHLRRGFERHLRRGDEAGFDRRQARIAGLDAFRLRRFRAAQRTAAARRCRSAAGSPAHRRRWSGRARSGPEAMSIGSSPGTSESSRFTTRAGWQAAASRPPLMADRCRRTQFISLMLAPLASRARLSACLSASVRPGSAQRQQRRAAAGDQAQHQVVGRQAPHHVEHARCAARSPAASGTGCAASTISMRSHGTA